MNFFVWVIVAPRLYLEMADMIISGGYVEYLRGSVKNVCMQFLHLYLCTSLYFDLRSPFRITYCFVWQCGQFGSIGVWGCN